MTKNQAERKIESYYKAISRCNSLVRELQEFFVENGVDISSDENIYYFLSGVCIYSEPELTYTHYCKLLENLERWVMGGKMDKANELDKMFDKMQNLIDGCDKSTYSEHWDAVVEYVRRAAFIVFNFHLPVSELERQLDKEKACAMAMKDMEQWVNEENS